MTGQRALRSYLEAARARARSHGARRVLCEVAVHLGATTDHVDTMALFSGWRPGPSDPGLRPPADWACPDLLGVVREALIDKPDRRQDGAFYTPPTLADLLAGATLDPLVGSTPLSVCDPAAGGGALLLAAVRFVRAHDGDLRALQLVAVDRDELALATAQVALSLAAPDVAVVTVIADALGPVVWPHPGAGRFDAVLANPPFLNQLAHATARSREQAADALGRFGVAAVGYADGASLFATLAVDLARIGGRIGLILPEALLATRDSAPARARIGASTRLDRMWLEPASTFAAGVRVCVTVMERTDAPPCTAVSERGDTGDGRWRSGDWAHLAADALGVPQCDVASDGVLADISSSTADFRDQFYGVAAVAIDDPTGDGPPRPRLMTSGLIDVLDNLWGIRTARIDRRDFAHPCADLTLLDEDDPLRAWAAARLVPKALLATQTSVLEVVPDEAGVLLPMVPVISIVPHAPSDLWRVIAVLAAPPISAIARRRAAGAALSRDAIKLSARQVAALPLPADLDAWSAGSHAAARASAASAAGDKGAWRSALDELGAAMCAAYRVDPEPVVPWWMARVERSTARRTPAAREPRDDVMLRGPTDKGPP